MSRLTAARVVDAPVDAVWSVFADLANRRTWLSDVESIDVLTPAVPALEVGTTWRETRVDRAGHTTTEELVILDIEPGHSITLGLAGTAQSPRLSYVFTPVAVGSHRGGTTMQVIVESEAVAEGRRRRIVNRLLTFMVGTFAARTAEGALRNELECLARRVAAGPAATGGLAA